MFHKSFSRLATRGLSLLAVCATLMLAFGGVLAPTPAAADAFASAAFQRVWQRADLPVSEHQVARTWVWGPEPHAAKQETYIQGANGTRLVQYFDKSRMEINDPTADPNSQWFVTNGLLAVELMTGRIQVGNSEFQQAYPASIPVAGDTNDPGQSAPTYAALGRVMDVYFGENGKLPAGTPVTAAIDKNGNWTPVGGPANQAKVAVYSQDTRHNIPDVFWQFLNSQGLVYENGHYTQGPLMNWIFVMGYPTTEPFWTTIRVGGSARQVLVQAFQRRILTFTPTNPAGWQVEMGNVGLHYYDWRYTRPNCSAVPVRGFGQVWADHPELAHALGCPQPSQGEQVVKTAVEPFEHGTMLWMDKPAGYAFPYSQPSIFVLFDDGTYQRFDDTYVEGQPNTCTPTPPKGFVLPVRGFNKVWCEGTGAKVRERLGWATAPETGDSGAWQLFDRGLMVASGPTVKQIFAFFDIYPYGEAQHRYLMYNDTFTP
jgi:hypothetical protein